MRWRVQTLQGEVCAVMLVSQPAQDDAMHSNAHGAVLETLSVCRFTPSRHQEQQPQAPWWTGMMFVAQHPCWQRSSWSIDKLRLPWSLLTII